MKIESISILNFRQFHNETNIQFSTDLEKNVTVILGANGSGKTSLLNAFKWCFYDTTDFDTGNDHILNEAAILEQAPDKPVELSVTVQFNHNKLKYFARRTQRYQRSNGINAVKIGKSDFIIDITGSDGQTKRSSTPDADLQSILPRDLQPYFFFNGERIELLAGVNQSVLIRDAIRKLMGLELVERATLHIRKAATKYNKAVMTQVTTEHAKVLDLIDRLRHENDLLDGQIQDQGRLEEKYTTERQLAETSLKKYETSIQMQERRDAIEKQTKELNEQATELRRRQKLQIDKDAHIVMTSGIFDECKALIESNRKKGVLPYGINAQFIDDRISLGTCICGTTVASGTKEHEQLLEIRESAGTDHQESSYTAIAAFLKSQESTTNQFFEEYQSKSTDLSNLLTNVDELNQEYTNIGATLVSHNDGEIANLEKKRTLAANKAQQARDNRKLAERDKEQNEGELNNLKKEKIRMEGQESKINTAQKRMDRCETIETALVDLKRSLSDQVRNDLSKKVDTIFQSIIRKPFRALIDDNYSLQVNKLLENGEEYQVNEQSTGERQVTSLSFISSIISLAKERHASKNTFFQGGLYPLVMDSPFGSLDDDYREKVASSMPTLAEQVIVFVSNSQWNGKVKQACENRVGNHYQLVYYSPKNSNDQTKGYTKKSENGFEYSVIEEIETL